MVTTRVVPAWLVETCTVAFLPAVFCTAAATASVSAWGSSMLYSSTVPPVNWVSSFTPRTATAPMPITKITAVTMAKIFFFSKNWKVFRCFFSRKFFSLLQAGYSSRDWSTMRETLTPTKQLTITPTSRV